MRGTSARLRGVTLELPYLERLAMAFIRLI